MMIRLLCMTALLASAWGTASAQTVTYSCQALGGTNCPARIRDAPQAALTSVITLPAAAGTLCAGTAGATAAVNLRSVHGWVGDLRASVAGPGGSASLLANLAGTSTGGCQGADIDASFTDGATAASCRGLIPAVSGSVAPAAPLAALTANQAQIPGAWTLTMQDTANNNDGALLDWGVTITCGALPVVYRPVPATSAWLQGLLLVLLALVAAVALQRRRRADSHGR